MLVPKLDDREFFVSRGWLEVVDKAPEDYDPAEKYPVRTSWTEDSKSGTITAVYELRDVVKPRETKQVKKLSKLKLTLFCT